MTATRIDKHWENGNWYPSLLQVFHLYRSDIIMALAIIQLLQGYLLPWVFIIASIFCESPAVPSRFYISHCIVF
jgi:hypothetical protein